MKSQPIHTVRFLLIVALTLGLLVPLSVAAPVGQNLLTNAGFEDYLAVGWGDVHPPWGRGSQNSDPAPYEGNNYLKLTTSVPDASISQEFDLEALGFDSHRLETGGYRVDIEGAMHTGNTQTAGIIWLGQYVESDYEETKIAQRKSPDWRVKSGTVYLQPGTTKVVYKFQAVTDTDSVVNEAYLDAACLKVRDNTIWAYGDVTDAFQASGDYTTSGLYKIGEKETGEVNITHGRTWTTNGQVAVAAWQTVFAKVYVDSGTWQANNSVVLGDYGTATVEITNNGTWNSTSDVFLTREARDYGSPPRAYIDIVDGQWNSSGTVHFGNETGRYGGTQVTIKPNGIWNSLGEIRMSEATSANLPQVRITVEGGTWNSSKTYIGINCNIPAIIQIMDNGLWTASGETVLGCAPAGSTEVTVENGRFISDGNVGVGDEGQASVEIKSNGIWTANDSVKIGYAGTGSVTVNGGTWTANDSVSLGGSGNGKVTVNSGTWTANDSVSLSGSGSESVTVNGGTWTANDSVSLDGSGSGSVNVNGGTWTSNNSVSLDGSGSKSINVNGGTWTANDLVSIGGADGGSVTVDGGTWNSSKTHIGMNTTDDPDHPTKVRIVNNGLWTASGETVLGCTTVSKTEVTIENSQFISDGDVYLGVGQTSLEIKDNGTWTSNEYVTIGQSGSGSVTVDGGTWNVAGSTIIGNQGNGEIVVQNGGLVDATGSLILGENGLFRIESGSTTIFNGGVSNYGKIRLTDSSMTIGHYSIMGDFDLEHSDLSILGADATLSLSQDLLIESDCGIQIGQGGTFAVGSDSFVTMLCPLEILNGDGNILLENGHLTLARHQLCLDGGTIQGSGEVLVGSKGIDLGVDGAITGTSPSEKLIVWGNVSGSGELANVALYGDLDVGNSPGTIEVGGLALSSSGSLTMELGGLVPGTEYDQILVSGTFALDGTLEVLWYDGFEAVAGDTFTLLDVTASGSLSGEFANLLLPTFTDPSLYWDITNLYTNGSITAVPEPMSLTLLCMGTLMLLVFRRRERKA